MRLMCVLLMSSLVVAAGCKDDGEASANLLAGEYVQLTQTCTELHPPVAGCGFCEIWAKVNATGDKVQFFSGESGGVPLDPETDCMAGTNVYGEIADGEEAIYWYTLSPAVETLFRMEKTAFDLDDPNNAWVYYEQGDF